MARPASTDVASLKARFLHAIDSGRSQTALRLAREMAKAEPQGDHSVILRQAFRLRAEHLQRDNQVSEAAVLWRHLLSLGEAPGVRELVAENLARCGFVSEAVNVASLLPADAPARSRIGSIVADAALEKGPAGKALLPVEHHAGFDAVLQAIAFAHEGRDEDARSAIQSIGLQSPFLEWKVFLRGLLAWYAGDDQRALETWGRLQPHRLPWRLAAPLRLGIDPEFRQTQSLAAQTALQKAADRATGSTDLELVRQVQTSLHKAKSFDETLRVSESLYKHWKATRPELIEPLRRTLASAILQRGKPTDLISLARQFGAAAVHPEYMRLLAVGAERRGQAGGAILSWLRYVATASPQKPFRSHQALADAKVWEHIGSLILELDDLLDMDEDEDLENIPTFDECFARAIELAPDRRRPYLLRFEALAAEPSLTKEAIAAGAALVERFPDDPKTLEQLGNLYRRTNARSKAFDAYERALALDPLNRKLRGRLALESLQRVIGGSRTKLATLRADLAKAEELSPDLAPVVFARRHFLEATKGDPEIAAEAARSLQALHHVRLAAPFLLAAEAKRYGAAEDWKKAAAELRVLAKTGGTPEELTLLARMMNIESSQSADSGVLQAGWAICKKARVEPWPERLLERFMLSLGEIPKLTGFSTFVRKAQKLHPQNPFLVLAGFDAVLRDRNASPWTLRELGERMESLFGELPRERQQEFLEQLSAHGMSMADLRRLGGTRSFLESIFDSL